MLLALDEDIPNRSVNPELISQLPDQEVNEQELEKTTSVNKFSFLKKLFIFFLAILFYLS